jgi:septal ring factor EnvC (AmiA/AmiB activator)
MGKNQTRRFFCGTLALALTSKAFGDDLKPEDLQKQLQNTLSQLHDEQDRKRELSTEKAKVEAENERLTTQLAGLQKDLKELIAENSRLGGPLADNPDRNAILRDHYAAWQQFMDSNPLIKMQWDLFIERNSAFAPNLETPYLDPDWPLSARG